MSYLELVEGRAPISQDWPDFAERLSMVLSALHEDQFLIVSDKNSRRYIQFAAQGAYGLRVEVSSNAYLPRHDRFTEGAIALLGAVGWHPPTGTPEASTPEDDPDGSPNFFIQYAAPINAANIASHAVSTLVGILGIPHPGFLTYEGADCNGNALSFPALRLKRTPADAANDPGAVAERLLALVREITGIESLGFDEDGVIGFSFGSTDTFVRLVGTPPYARLYAPLMWDAKESLELLSQLNALNARTGLVRFFLADGTVFAIADLPAAPLDFAHLDTVLGRFCEIANGMQEVFKAKFVRDAGDSDSGGGSSIH